MFPLHPPSPKGTPIHPRLRKSGAFWAVLCKEPAEHPGPRTPTYLPNPRRKASAFMHGDRRRVPYLGLGTGAPRPLTIIMFKPRMWTCVRCFSIGSIQQKDRKPSLTRRLKSAVGSITTCLLSARKKDMLHEMAAGYPYDSSRGKAARRGSSRELEHML